MSWFVFSRGIPLSNYKIKSVEPIFRLGPVLHNRHKQVPVPDHKTIICTSFSLESAELRR